MTTDVQNRIEMENNILQKESGMVVLGTVDSLEIRGCTNARVHMLLEILNTCYHA